jgi:hypothetical protein
MLCSVAFRLFRLLSYQSGNSFTRHVFGSAAPYWSSLLPRHIQGISPWLMGCPTPLEILSRLTAFGCLTAFCSDSFRTQFSNGLLDTANGPALRIWGRLGVLQPLRCCPVCVERDLTTYGVSYWHRSHQIPLVHWCWMHECPLVECPHEAYDHGLPLPPDEADATVRSAVAPFQRRLVQAIRYAHIVHDSFDGDRPSRESLLQIYRSRLCALGLIRWDRIAMNQLSSRYSEVLAQIVYDGSTETATKWIHSLLNSVRMTTSPSRHLSFITAIFGDWNTFIEQSPDCVQERRTADRIAKPRRHLSDEIPSHGLTMCLKRRRLSLEQTAKKMGWSAGAVTVRANVLGLIHTNFGSRLDGKRRAALVDDLRRNVPARLLAKKYGVSESTVRRVLHTSAGAELARVQCRADQDLAEHRQELDTLTGNGLAASDVRRSKPALYTWLIRHDAAWFHEHVRYIRRTHTT